MTESTRPPAWKYVLSSGISRESLLAHSRHVFVASYAVVLPSGWSERNAVSMEALVV